MFLFDVRVPREDTGHSVDSNSTDESSQRSHESQSHERRERGASPETRDREPGLSRGRAAELEIMLRSQRGSGSAHTDTLPHITQSQRLKQTDGEPINLSSHGLRGRTVPRAVSDLDQTLDTHTGVHLQPVHSVSTVSKSVDFKSFAHTAARACVANPIASDGSCTGAGPP